jgi:hypothetical protein
VAMVNAAIDPSKLNAAKVSAPSPAPVS